MTPLLSHILRSSWFLAAMLVAAISADAAVPALLNHQGRIAVGTVNFEGTGQFKFALVSANGTTTYWSNDGTSTTGDEPTDAVSLTVTKGLYSVLLGDTTLTNMTAIPASIFVNDDVRLRVWFNDGPTGFEQITPDQRLAASPYALVASTVDQVLLSAVVAPPLKPVVAWGRNSAGQTTVPSLSHVAAVAGGGTQSYALLDNGTVVGWGGAAAVPGTVTNATHIAAGIDHALVRKSDGTVEAWGNNSFSKATVPGGITNAVDVAAGEKHSLILRADRTVTTLGYVFVDSPEIPAVAPPVALTNVTAIAAGSDHSLALKEDGTVVAWGRDDSGQVSGTAPIFGTILAVINPTQVQLSQSLAAATQDLSFNGGSTQSATSNGTDVVTVTDATALIPGMVVTGTTVLNPASLTGIIAIGAGAFHSLAVKNDGTVVAWGLGTGGQTTVPFGLTGVTKVTGGNTFSMALKSDGSVVVWGDAADGKTLIPDDATQVTGIAAGTDHALVLRTDLIPAQVARLDQDNVFAGKIGIGRVAATNELEVQGNASKTTAGNWLANSDRRIKDEIQPLTGALETLDKVRLVDFRYTDEYRAKHPGIDDKRYLNVIAQEFAEVFPDHVQSSGEKLPDGSEILQVDTYPLTIYSAAAVQELHRENERLKTQLADQEQRLRRLERAVSK